MTERCKVLFLSAPIGSGHIRAAHAVGAAMHSLAPAVEVGFANIFDFLHPRLGRGLLQGYLRLLDYCPGLYGRLYQWGNSGQSAVACRELVNRYLAQRMHNYLQTHSPSAIVCTHATPAGLVAHLCKTGKLSVPVFAVVTDFIVHRLWLYPEMTDYFVAHNELRVFFGNHDIDGNHIHALGIPVDAKFSAPYDRASLQSALGLSNDRKTLLIMGGGAGVMPMSDIISACDGITEPLQIIAVAGNNTALRRKLFDLKPNLKHCTLLPLGYVDNVHELMAVSDILISKPGGMTAAEAMSRSLPLIIFRPIPGQEEANTRYLVDRAAAETVSNTADLRAKVKELLFTHPQHLVSLRQNAAALGRPDAAQDIAQVVLAALNRTKC